MWLRKSSRALLIAARELEKGGEVARGVRRVRAPARGAVSADAANIHGKRREGDEEGEDERQRLTETSRARRRKEEADRGEEEDELTGTHCSSVGTARRRRK